MRHTKLPAFARFNHVDTDAGEDYEDYIICFTGDDSGIVVASKEAYPYLRIGKFKTNLISIDCPLKKKNTYYWEIIPKGAMQIAYPEAYRRGMDFINRGEEE